MEQEARFVGIDVSKAQVDVGVRPMGQRWVASYDEAGIGELVFQLVDLSPALVLLEASGGLGLPLVAALSTAAGAGVSVGVGAGVLVGVAVGVAVGSGVGARSSLQAFRTTAMARTANTASQRIRRGYTVISMVSFHLVLELPGARMAYMPLSAF